MHWRRTDRPALRLDHIQLDAEPDEPDEPDIVGTDAAMQTANRWSRSSAISSLPTGMSASVTAGYFTSLSVRSRSPTAATQAQVSTPRRGIVERDEAPLDNGDGSCDAFPGSWATVTLSGGNDTTVVSGKCYRYRLKISDNVGNQGTPAGTSATAKVDTSARATPTLSYGSFTNTYTQRRRRVLPAGRGQRPVPGHRRRVD